MTYVKFFAAMLGITVFSVFGTLTSARAVSEGKTDIAQTQDRIARAAGAAIDDQDIDTNQKPRRFAQWYNWGNWSNWPNWRNWVNY